LWYNKDDREGGILVNIIFGGSFNPPTIAHMKIAEYLLDSFPKATLTFLPNGNRYHRKTLIDATHRIHMLQLMADRFPKRVRISDHEAVQETFLGTYHTLKQFERPYFVIGLDSLATIETWIEAEKLVRENDFLVIPRKGYTFESILEQSALLKENAFRFTLLNHFPVCDASSSAFRKTKNFDYLIPEIKQYIIDHQLY